MDPGLCLEPAWAQRFQPTQDGAGSWPLKRYELGLRRGFAYRMEIVRRVLLRPRVWQRFDLPEALFPLYTLLSPVEWIFFHRWSLAAGVARTRRSPWNRWRALPHRKNGCCWRHLEPSLSRAARWCCCRCVGSFAGWKAGAGHRIRRPPFWRPRFIEPVRWAVLTVARYGPVSFVCFPQALAAHAMLRRRGIGSIMHYGVRRSADRKLRAHTWLEVDHRMLLGGESALLFAPIHSTNASSE